MHLYWRESRSRPDVVGQAAVLLHFIKLSGVDQRKRIFLAVNHMRLQSAVKLIVVERRGTGAKSGEERRVGGIRWHTKLQTGEIGRRTHRTQRRSDLAEAVVP